MGKKRKTKKKTGCLGLLVNFIITLVCLTITALIFYLVYIVVTADGPVDPVEEFKQLPERLKELWEWTLDKIESFQNKEDGVIEKPVAPAEAPAAE